MHLVKYTLITNDTKKETKLEQDACFAFVRYKIKFKNKSHIRYYFDKHDYSLEYKEEEQYLKNLQEIPAFSEYINIEECLKQRYWSFDLDKPILHFSILATLIRNMQENPDIIRFSNWVKDKINIPFINILLLLSDRALNTGHYIGTPVYNNNQVQTALQPFNQDRWNKASETMKTPRTYFGGIFLFFNSSFQWIRPKNIDHPIYVQLQKLYVEWKKTYEHISNT